MWWRWGWPRFRERMAAARVWALDWRIWWGSGVSSMGTNSSPVETRAMEGKEETSNWAQPQEAATAISFGERRVPG